jgi:hypothetical protein
MSDLYVRKSSFTRAGIRTLLSSDPVFNKLSLDQKNYAIDIAVNKVAEYRNKLGKEDYNFDTAGAGVPFINITNVDDITIQLLSGILSTKRILPRQLTQIEIDGETFTDAEIIFNLTTGIYQFYNPTLGKFEAKVSTNLP